MNLETDILLTSDYSEPDLNVDLDLYDLKTEVDSPFPVTFSKTDTQANIDLLFFKRLVRIMRLSGTTFFSRPHLNIWQLMLIAIYLSQATVCVADWNGEIIQKLTMKKDIWDSIPLGALFGVSMALGYSLALFIADLLSLHWRKNLTENLTKNYLKGTNLFLVNYVKTVSVDNPDQRIVADIKSLCDNLAKVVCNGFQGLTSISLLSYSIFNHLGWSAVLMIYCPLILFLFVYKYVLGKLAVYTFEQDKLEGNFRYFHARIRDYAESIAFYHGEEMERKNCETSLQDAIQNKKIIAKWSTIFQFLLQITRWVPDVLIMFGTALILWAYDLDQGELSAKMTTIQSEVFVMMTSISTIVSLGEQIGIIAGSVGRVAQLQEVCGHLNQISEGQQVHLHDSDGLVHLKNVTCCTPHNTKLVSDLNLKIEKGCNFLIMGPSGCGKSSLLRCFSGLWQFSGHIYRPSKLGSDGIFYLPQKPYLVNGTLRDQIVYPGSGKPLGDSFDDQILEILKKTNIDHLYKQRGWNTVCRWSEILSPGEQQRLMFARLFYHKPTFAVLDEATSALDTENEKNLYLECLRLGITLISVGHRKNLMQFHNCLLLFDGKGGHLIKEICSKEKMSCDQKEESWIQQEIKEGTWDLTVPPETPTLERTVESKTGGILQYLSSTWWLLKKGHGPIWTSPCCFTQKSLIFIGFIIASVFCSLSLGAFPLTIRWLADAIISRDEPNFYLYTFISLAVATIMCIVLGFTSACIYWLGIHYRKSLTEYVHQIYFKNNVMLRLNTINKEIDNPDQRMTGEIDFFTSGFEPSGLPALMQMIFMSAPVPLICLSVVAFYVGWLAVFFAVGIIIIMFGISFFFVPYIGELEFRLGKAEGDFRYIHIELRENAEAICFYGAVGIERERVNLSLSFEKLLTAQWNQIKGRGLFNLYYQFFIVNVRTFSLIIVLGSLTILDTLQTIPSEQIYGLISQSVTMNTMAFVTSILILASIGKIAQNNGHVARIIQMCTTISKLESEKWSMSSLDQQPGKEIQFQDVVCVTPTGKILNQFGISVVVPPKEGLVLMGPSGVGKSSLLRVLSGLWPLAQGNIVLPPGTLFLPQKAYMVIGSLRDQIIYPKTIKDEDLPSDGTLGKFLDKAQLGYLLDRFSLDSVEIWSSVLSPGEQQRLSMARLFFHCPAFAVLDESTSALDPENEDAMYEMCRSLEIGLVSVGHRESLTRQHNILLKLDGKGGWELLRRR